MPSIINATTTNGVAISPDNSGSLQLATNNGTTAVTIDTSQNVGVGTSSPSERLDVQGTADIKARIYTTGATLLTHAGVSLKTGSYEYLIQNLTTTAGSAGALRFYDITAGTERMRIDSSGRVTMPNQPAFHAYRDGGDVSGGNVFVCNNTKFNTGSHYNTSNGRFTAPVTGRYYFVFNFLLPDGSPSGTAGEANLRLNGSIYKSIRYVPQDSSNYGHSTSPSLACIVNMNSGDYVDLYVANITVFGGGADWSTFSGYLIG